VLIFTIHKYYLIHFIFKIITKYIYTSLNSDFCSKIQKERYLFACEKSSFFLKYTRCTQNLVSKSSEIRANNQPITNKNNARIPAHGTGWVFSRAQQRLDCIFPLSAQVACFPVLENSIMLQLYLKFSFSILLFTAESVLLDSVKQSQITSRV